MSIPITISNQATTINQQQTFPILMLPNATRPSSRVHLPVGLLNTLLEAININIQLVDTPTPITGTNTRLGAISTPTMGTSTQQTGATTSILNIKIFAQLLALAVRVVHQCRMEGTSTLLDSSESMATRIRMQDMPEVTTASAVDRTTPVPQTAVPTHTDLDLTHSRF